MIELSCRNLFCKSWRYLCIVIVLVIAQGHAFGLPNWTRFVATAYSVTGETKSQSITQEGRTVAADPRVLPIGTVIEIRNAGPYSGQYVVQDTGTKIVGRKIDIYIARTREAIKFGVRKVRVRILKPAPETPEGQRRAAAEVSIAPKPPKDERVSSYYQYQSEGETASVE
jgi:3D (Asp-Asp-Asp) domain-containing protein